ncbi:GPP34 family phosphoprotein [Streptomyces sp. NPDC021093]|uniref:GOLPH3/VPS74 family protein n=1 Tax=Streptomyces sp. NPDC021093 TaxID=3365112 RepID=UPI0037AB9837
MSPLPPLSLPEELLLLGLQPERGGMRVKVSYVEYGVAGAVLAELERVGCIEQDRGRVQIRTPVPPPALTSGPTADPVAVRVLAGLPGPGKGRHGGVRTASFVRRARREVTGQYLDRLVERGALRRESKRVLGLFPVVRHPAAGTDWSAPLQHRLQSAAKSGFPDHRDQLLAAFLWATDLANKHFRGNAARQVRARMRDFGRREWAAKAVHSAVAGEKAAAQGGGGG